MRSLPIVAAAGLIAASAFALHELRVGRQAPTVVVAPQPALQEPEPATPLPPLPRTVDARPQIHRVIEEAAPSLKSPRDVEQYLGDLEARARRNHQLTALEVEPGLAAIRRLGGSLEPQRAFEMEAEFVKRMNRLAAELAPSDG
jgi:hypothetical protein